MAAAAPHWLHSSGPDSLMQIRVDSIMRSGVVLEWSARAGHWRAYDCSHAPACGVLLHMLPNGDALAVVRRAEVIGRLLTARGKRGADVWARDDLAQFGITVL